MIVASEIQQAASAAADLRAAGTLALVPTMGNLHEGHLTLVRAARKNARSVAVSIFVNPLQFNNPKDLETYPRTLDADLAKLEGEGVDLVFTPTAEIMYPEGMENHTSVFVPGLSDMLEGALRPGHFRGVTTVVSKLFNIFRPDCAMFGLKDFQQVAVLKKMVRDMAIGVKIIEVPIVRDQSGLALSSRNSLLSEEERRRACLISREMNAIREEILSGNRDFAAVVSAARARIDGNEGFRTDAIDIVDALTLKPVDEHTLRAAVLMAVYLGKVRLIDSVAFDLAPERC
ncbi:MAG: pantoate--beta-alanine ligase [Succinivibrionaceae bacterium]|nr:pantoate--beta-alanine ligase [Succinivibrionaceae bacterium]